MPGNDNIILYSGTSYYRLFRDGTSVELGRWWWSGSDADIDQAPLDGELVMTWAGVTYYIDPKTHLINWNRVFDTGTLGVTLGKGVFLRNRAGVMKYYEDNLTSLKRWDVATNTDEGSVLTIPGISGSSTDLHWAGDQILMAGRTTGEIVLVDLDTFEILLSSEIDPFTNAVYDTEFDNVISLQADGTIKVWDSALQPAALSAIALDPASVERYHAVSLEVTVTGSNGELVADVPVSWLAGPIVPVNNSVNSFSINTKAVNAGSTIGVSKGQILPAVSLTDSLGIARATYCPPGLDWVIAEDELIEASITV